MGAKRGRAWNVKMDVNDSEVLSKFRNQIFERMNFSVSIGVSSLEEKVKRLERTIKASEAITNSFSSSVEWLRMFEEELDKVLDVNVVTESYLSFSPKQVLKREQERVQHAQRSLAKIKAGKMARPSVSIEKTLESLDDQETKLADYELEIEEVRYKLEKEFGAYVIDQVADEVNRAWRNRQLKKA